jgi:acyl-CoA reductase-like NAD-dependent aldehyde dehydrogenase
VSTVEVERQDLFIGGEWTPSSDQSTFSKRDPFTGEPVTVAAAAGRDDARRACDAARDAFWGWADAPPAERRTILNRAADLLLERAPEIAATMTEETGSTVGWGMFNCDLASRMLREAAAQAYAVTGEVIPSDVPGSLAMAVRQPAGVVVGMAPWNAPVILSTRAVAAPLAVGNTVVLKASEECPRTHAAVVHALHDAGLPPGVLNFLSNAPIEAPAIVDELIAHPAVRRINFTGNTEVGRIIAQKCALLLKRCLLELGGKAPQIVLADADLDAAADAATFGAFMNSGQICMSTERIVADRQVAVALGDKLAYRARKLVVGDPRDQATMIGPVINERARKRIADLIEDATGKGAQVLAGGEPDGNLIPPTVLTGVTPQMRIYTEETFGPVVTIVPVDGPDEAIEVANDTDFGLAASVFSRNVETAMMVARRIESGICHINSSTVHDEPQMPFGGVKESGWGRFGGRAGLEEFTELRWMTVQQGPRQYPI